ncbi:unnamed protein product [marine sediment metagenome]|uniref:Uncharacterized protein n=1 Tax=marine sediment metagenome TaxID=412755 RepID=X1JPX2_9ZZZZ
MDTSFSSYLSSSSVRERISLDPEKFEASLPGKEGSLSNFKGLLKDGRLELLWTPAEGGKKNILGASLLDKKGNPLTIANVIATYEASSHDKRKFSAAFKGRVEKGQLHGELLAQKGKLSGVVSLAQPKDARINNLA